MVHPLLSKNPGSAPVYDWLESDKVMDTTSSPGRFSLALGAGLGTRLAELHISVDLLCGATAAETFETFSKNRPIVDLQQILKYARFTKIQQTFKRWTLYEERIKDVSKRLRTHESPRELVRQSEAKRKLAPQSEANVCRRRRQMQSCKNLPY